MEEKLFLSIAEVAKRLDCGPSFVYSLLRRGELTPVVKLGRRTKIPATAVEALVTRLVEESVRRRQLTAAIGEGLRQRRPGRPLSSQ